MLGLRETGYLPFGFIKAVNTNTGAEVAAKGDIIKVPIGKAGAMIDTPVGFSFPNAANSDVDSINMELQYAKTVPIDWNGEDQKAMMNSGAWGTVLAQQFADAFGQIRDAIEKSVADEAVKAASRAYGTAGAAPFASGSSMADMANMKGILDLNKAPATGRTIVLSSEAETSLLTNQTNLIKVNEAGSDAMIRNGIIMPVYGFNVRSSAQLEQHSKGSAASYVTNLSASLNPGDQTVAIDTGTGTFNDGDVVTFTGDTNKYVVNDSTADSITIGEPGLRKTLADGVAVTLGNDYTPSIALHKSAIALAIRPPKAPNEGDMMTRELITDPYSGITFEVALVKGQRVVQYQVSAVWGVKAVNPAWIATLLG
jgi:hypothetical protein